MLSLPRIQQKSDNQEAGELSRLAWLDANSTPIITMCFLQGFLVSLNDEKELF
jgi:hypothetical protein